MSAIGNCPDLDALAALAREATPDIKSWVHNYRIYDLPPQDKAYLNALDRAVVLGLIELIAQCKATLEALHPSAGLPDSDVARLYNAMMEKLT